MTNTLVLLIAGILIVLAYDYTNGLQDAANMLATIVASRAATPIQAAILVSVFTFLGPVLGGTAVANTIGNFIDVTDLQNIASLTIVLSGLGGRNRVEFNYLVVRTASILFSSARRRSGWGCAGFCRTRACRMGDVRVERRARERRHQGPGCAAYFASPRISVRLDYPPLGKICAARRSSGRQS